MSKWIVGKHLSKLSGIFYNIGQKRKLFKSPKLKWAIESIWGLKKLVKIWWVFVKDFNGNGSWREKNTFPIINIPAKHFQKNFNSNIHRMLWNWMLKRRGKKMRMYSIQIWIGFILEIYTRVTRVVYFMDIIWNGEMLPGPRGCCIIASSFQSAHFKMWPLLAAVVRSIFFSVSFCFHLAPLYVNNFRPISTAIRDRRYQTKHFKRDTISNGTWMNGWLVGWMYGCIYTIAAH